MSGGAVFRLDGTYDDDDDDDDYVQLKESDVDTIRGDNDRSVSPSEQALERLARYRGGYR